MSIAIIFFVGGLLEVNDINIISGFFVEGILKKLSSLTAFR